MQVVKRFCFFSLTTKWLIPFNNTVPSVCRRSWYNPNVDCVRPPKLD